MGCKGSRSGKGNRDSRCIILSTSKISACFEGKLMILSVNDSYDHYDSNNSSIPNPNKSDHPNKPKSLIIQPTLTTLITLV